ncbi:site-specific integrase [Clostridia bacterium]|nr:site-specific integrase [Clostridia bacterium]
MENQIEKLIKSIERLNDNFDRYFLRDSASAPVPVSPAPLLYDYLAEYLNTYRRKFQSVLTLAENFNRIEKQVKPNLENKPLNSYSTLELQELINRFENTPNAQKKLAVLVGGAFLKAVDTGLISFNPFKAVEIVPLRSESYSVIQPKQQLKILKAIKDDRYRDLFVFCCCTGMRLGEAFSIVIDRDIDFRQKVISIPLDDTSKKKHKRNIPFLPDIIPVGRLSGKLFEFSQSAAQSYFKRLFKKMNIPAVPHSFRHTFISCCHYIGISPKQVQVWAGHSTISMTMDRYTHIIEGRETPIIDYLKRLKKFLKI